MSSGPSQKGMIQFPPLFIAPGWLGLCVGRIYLTLVDHRQHPPLFSERCGTGSYRSLFKVGSWQCGVRLG